MDYGRSLRGYHGLGRRVGTCWGFALLGVFASASVVSAKCPIDAEVVAFLGDGQRFDQPNGKAQMSFTTSSPQESGYVLGCKGNWIHAYFGHLDNKDFWMLSKMVRVKMRDNQVYEYNATKKVWGGMHGLNN